MDPGTAPTHAQSVHAHEDMTWCGDSWSNGRGLKGGGGEGSLKTANGLRITYSKYSRDGGLSRPEHHASGARDPSPTAHARKVEPHGTALSVALPDPSPFQPS